MAPDKMQLQDMSKKSVETFKEYAQKVEGVGCLGGTTSAREGNDNHVH